MIGPDKSVMFGEFFGDDQEMPSDAVENYHLLMDLCKKLGVN